MLDQELSPALTHEVTSVAREMAGAYAEMAAFYRERMDLTSAEAEDRARALSDEEHQQLIRRPPDQVSWWDLSLLAERQP